MTRRVLRIFPAFIFVLLLYLLSVEILGKSFFSAPLTIENLVSNVLFIQPITNLFMDGITMDIVPGTWTLIPEIYFYLSLPIIAMLTKRTRIFIVVMIGIIVASVLCRPLMFSNENYSVIITLVAQLDKFCFGMILARIYANLDEGKDYHKYSYYLFFSGCFLFLWSWYTYKALLVDQFFQSGLGCVLMLAGILLNKGNLKKVFQNRVLCLIGLVSYSIFLTHDSLVWYFFNLIMDSLNIISPVARLCFLMTFGVLVSVGIGYLMYRFIEKPFLSKDLDVFAAARNWGISFIAAVLFIGVLFAGAVFSRSGYSTNFIASSKITESRINLNSSYSLIWESRKAADFTLINSPEHAVVINEEDNGFTLNGDAPWTAIISKIPEELIKELEGKKIILTANVNADRANLVYAGLTLDGKDTFGDPAYKGKQKFISVSTLLPTELQADPQLRVNIFPQRTGTYDVKVNRIAIYVQE
ncbi:Acyltransferase family protein [compost metagenome]